MQLFHLSRDYIIRARFITRFIMKIMMIIKIIIIMIIIIRKCACAFRARTFE